MALATYLGGMSRMPYRNHVAVIGDGLSGVAVTAELLQQGFRVTWLEDETRQPDEQLLLCRQTDAAFLEFLQQHDLGDMLRWYPAPHGIRQGQHTMPLSRWWQVLRFFPLKRHERVDAVYRLTKLLLRNRGHVAPDESILEHQNGIEWSQRTLGEPLTRTLVLPLLQKRYGWYKTMVPANVVRASVLRLLDPASTDVGSLPGGLGALRRELLGRQEVTSERYGKADIRSERVDAVVPEGSRITVRWNGSQETFDAAIIETTGRRQRLFELLPTRAPGWYQRSRLAADRLTKLIVTLKVRTDGHFGSEQARRLTLFDAGHSFGELMEVTEMTPQRERVQRVLRLSASLPSYHAYLDGSLTDIADAAIFAVRHSFAEAEVDVDAVSVEEAPGGYPFSLYRQTHPMVVSPWDRLLWLGLPVPSVTGLTLQSQFAGCTHAVALIKARLTAGKQAVEAEVSPSVVASPAA